MYYINVHTQTRMYVPMHTCKYIAPGGTDGCECLLVLDPLQGQQALSWAMSTAPSNIHFMELWGKHGVEEFDLIYV